jgi:hypothetical protein
MCYECGYRPKLCEHNRRKYNCVDCKNIICPHNKQKSK